MPYFRRSGWKARAEEYIRSQIRDKPYADIFRVDIMFIDNTRSGSYFWFPDKTTFALRQQILEDAQHGPSASDRIPLRWLPFTHGLQNQKVGGHKPVLTVEEVTRKANQLCGIPPDEVPAMLRFHHNLGLLLHYDHIPSLRNYVIIDVQWLVKVTSALLHPLTTGHRDFEAQFQLLHDHGILLESLAVHIWSVRCPEEAAHLSSPEQRSLLFHLYESFGMLYDTGKKMVPPGGDTPSCAWLCPPLVRRQGEAVSSLFIPKRRRAANLSSGVKRSPFIYLVCRKGLLLLHTQFWRLVVACMCFFHKADSSPSLLQVASSRMPSIFHRSARMPCDAVFPGYHLCITYFNEGLELVVLREDAAVKACRATGGSVHPIEEVCSKLLVFVEEKLEELKGGGVAQPVWRRMGRCRCQQPRPPCRMHDRRDCPSPDCLHFVDLSDNIPCCPLGEHPAQNEVVEEVYPTWIKVSEEMARVLINAFKSCNSTRYTESSAYGFAGKRQS